MDIFVVISSFLVPMGFLGCKSASVCCWYVSLVVGRWVLIYDFSMSIVNGSLYLYLSSYLYLYLSSHLYWYLHL